MKKKNVTICLTEEAIERGLSLAINENTSFSRLINDLILDRARYIRDNAAIGGLRELIPNDNAVTGFFPPPKQNGHLWRKFCEEQQLLAEMV